ncbi:MAG: efflux RND transporter periplasmic adaptor subunit [Bacteroidales bacterium]|nr:efflux RND transporter periplasmic adaptor subunit [Bacteroidales bacterium]
MNKKKIITIACVAAAALLALIIIGKKSTKNANTNLFGSASYGAFDIIVTTTGELEAENSVDITGPSLMNSRRMRMSQFEITDLVPEGTEVKAGDYVASLDRTSFENTLKDEQESLQTLLSNLDVTALDTAVTLSNLRDQIINYRYSVEEAEITLQQSTYESPSTIRQAEISVDKAKRTLDQALKSYELSLEQAKSDMRKAETDVADQREYVNDIINILSQFEVKAPQDGMVIYKKDRDGSKITIGSSISPFDNVVATLPDMSRMQSKTYVNEVDINKVKVGQAVEIEIDAFPEKKYTGVVKSVANIGEQLPNADAKVFEVVISLNESDAVLKPSMTTSNKIITGSYSDVVYVPIESVQNDVDSIPFIYMKNGNKQVVVTGASNENNIIVEQGISVGDVFYINTPEDADRFRKRDGEDLIPIIKQRKADEEAAERAASEQQQQRPRGAGGRGGFGGGGQMPQGSNYGGGQFQGQGGGQMPQGSNSGSGQTQGQGSGNGGQTQQGSTSGGGQAQGQSAGSSRQMPEGFTPGSGQMPEGFTPGSGQRPSGTSQQQRPQGSTGQN